MAGWRLGRVGSAYAADDPVDLACGLPCQVLDLGQCIQQAIRVLVVPQPRGAGTHGDGAHRVAGGVVEVAGDPGAFLRDGEEALALGVAPGAPGPFSQLGVARSVVWDRLQQRTWTGHDDRGSRAVPRVPGGGRRRGRDRPGDQLLHSGLACAARTTSSAWSTRTPPASSWADPNHLARPETFRPPRCGTSSADREVHRDTCTRLADRRGCFRVIWGRVWLGRLPGGDASWEGGYAS
jgi:hypothetical protein